MFWMGLGSLFWFLVLALAIWLLVRWFSGRTTLSTPHAPSPLPVPPSALEILRQRYARGEIDTATFENMRERLNATGAREEPPVLLQH
jgi:putative membrane protein